MDSEPLWTRSSFCSSGTCLEVAPTPGGVLLRDSKHPDRPAHTFTTAEWDAFTTAIRAGEFDDL